MTDISDRRTMVRHVERPWGAFRQYATNEPCTVSLMWVKPGQRLSLQAHRGRAELWIVLDEGAEIQVGDNTYHPGAGEEFWIDAGQKHRLSSTGPAVRVLEVAFGDWQQEDITRYADDYQRPAQGD
jgi:mannose-6-phosphate isomerase